MPKRLLTLSNERIDKEDFDLASYGFTQESLKLINEKLTIDTLSRLIQGFRVSIADQSASPGEFTIYNGVAIDRNGQLVRNEDQVNTALTEVVAGASTSFYIEVEFVEQMAETDARAFWDPTITNAAPIPDGGEVGFSVNTRMSQSWRIVTPISTVSFDKDNFRTSARIPIAVLTTNGSNEIVTVDSLVPPAASVMKKASTGDNKVEISDSTIFTIGMGIDVTDIGTANTQATTITAIDYDNHVITVNPILSLDLLEGSTCICSDVGATTFIAETEDPNDSRFDLSVDLQPNDQSKRLFQGDETRGTGVITSKYDITLRSDVDIHSEKDHVDALAAIIREMKFGSPRSGVINSDPNLAFGASTRWVDPIPGILPSRTVSVTIGDGITTFGDFNGTDETPFNSAVSYLAGFGGSKSIYVKYGTYTLNSSIDFTSFGASDVIQIKGDATKPVIECNHAGPGFLGDSTTNFSISNIQFNLTGPATHFFADLSTLDCFNCTIPRSLVVGTGEVRLEFNKCTFTGQQEVNKGSVTRLSLLNCKFNSATPVHAFDIYCPVTHTYIDDFEFLLAGCLLKFRNTADNITISTIYGQGNSTSGNILPFLEFVSTSSSVSISNVVFNSKFTLDVAAGSRYFIQFGDVTFNTKIDTVSVEIEVENAGSNFCTAIQIESSVGNATNIISGVSITSFVPAQDFWGVNCSFGYYEITGCYFETNLGISAFAANTAITNCTFIADVLADSSVTTWTAIKGFSSNLAVSNCKIVGNSLFTASTTSIKGLDLVSTETRINGCDFSGFGGPGCLASVYGVYSSGAGGGTPKPLSMTNCLMENFESDTYASGFYLDNPDVVLTVTSSSFLDFSGGNPLTVRCVDVVRSQDTLVSNCYMEDTGYGVVVLLTDKATVEGCQMTGITPAGITINTTTHANVIGNIIEGSGTTSSSYGIFYRAAKGTVANNSVEWNNSLAPAIALNSSASGTLFSFTGNSGRNTAGGSTGIVIDFTAGGTGVYTGNSSSPVGSYTGGTAGTNT